MGSLAIPLAATTQSSRNMADYVFTAFFIHFVVVSAVNSGFPANGAWWVACGVGFLFGLFTTEFVSHQLELMSYESLLGVVKADSGDLESSLSPVNSAPVTRVNNEDIHLDNLGMEGKQAPLHSKQRAKPFI